MKKLFTVIAASCCLMCSYAQFQFTDGPFSSDLSAGALWANGDTSFVVYNELLYQTFNGGTNWELTGLPLNSDPRTVELSEGKLIIGTNDGSRIYTSTDFGTTFTGGTGSVTGILVPTASTSGPNLMMIGGTNADPHLFDFQSDDWVSSGNGGITHGIGYLGGDTIWICSGGVQTGTTQYSHDLGVSWTTVNTEPSTDVGGGVVLTTKATDFTRAGGNVIVSTALNGFPVLFTSDNGTTWQASNLSGVSGLYGQKFLHISDDNVLFLHAGKLYQSVDQGATWTEIQDLNGAGHSIQLWKNDHVLISTSSGLKEFDNNGAGNLVAIHNFPLNVKHLHQSGSNSILASTVSGLYEYNTTSQLWTFVNNEYDSGSIMEPEFSVTIGDSLYACNQGLFVSGDGGVTFEQRTYPDVGSVRINGMFEIGGAWVLTSRDYWNGGGAPGDPRIFVSTNQGMSWIEGSFTNNIAYGFFGAENYIQNIFEHDNVLVADLLTGYAISDDSGSTWTFKGEGTEVTDVVSANGTLYRKKLFGFSLENRSLDVSTDNGDNWSSIPTSGLPMPGGTNYLGFGPIFELNNDLVLYNANIQPIGLYLYNDVQSSWSIIPGSAGLEDETFDNLLEVDGELYATWQNNGVYSTGSTINSIGELNASSGIVYPNPIQLGESLSINQTGKIKLYSFSGQLIYASETSINELVISSDWKRGMYVLVIETATTTQIQKIQIKE